MILQTKNFGEIEIDESGILTFEEGIPGFEDVKRFTHLSSGEDSLFSWLQCVDKPDLAFAVVDPFSIIKDYDIEIDNETLNSLGIEEEADVLVYSIVVIPDDVSKVSMNLKAPVIINRRNGKGMQRILDTDRYRVRHYILEELRRQEVTESAGTDKEEKPINNNK